MLKLFIFLFKDITMISLNKKMNNINIFKLFHNASFNK
jgi:hypothetical protein